jgi:hypothetical protein
MMLRGHAKPAVGTSIKCTRNDITAIIKLGGPFCPDSAMLHGDEIGEAWDQAEGALTADEKAIHEASALRRSAGKSGDKSD